MNREVKEKWLVLAAKLRTVLLESDVEKDFIGECLNAVGNIIIPDFEE